MIFWIVLTGVTFPYLGIAILGGSITIGTETTHIHCSTPGLAGRWRLIKAHHHDE